MSDMIDYATMLGLKRWNTPTIYNGWEQITKRDASAECFNRQETRDFMPHMGIMVGRAITVVIQPSKKEHKTKMPQNSAEYSNYVAAQGPGPNIVVVQDLDSPNNIVGSFWGEVNSNVHKSLGCVGTITDGAIRDWDEMNNAGFKALARRFCVGHAFSHPVKWGCEVEVFGCKVQPGQLIHADKHGFLVIPREDEAKLLEASRFMDELECKTFLAATRTSSGKTRAEMLEALKDCRERFGKAVKEKFRGQGEW